MTKTKKRSTVQAKRDWALKQLALAHEENRTRGRKSLDTVLSALEDSDQPLTAGEVHKLLAANGTSFTDSSYVRELLRKLVAEGKVSTRNETPAERAIRVSVNPDNAWRGAHFTAVYFWAPAGKVPRRTAPVYVAQPKAKRKSKKSKSKKTVTQTAGLSARVEALTGELALLKRIAELENQLSAIRKTLG